MTDAVEIWLAQYLCPQRHAVMAVAYEPSEQTAAEAEAIVRAAMALNDPWCGLCGSRDLHFEHRRTAFTDWDTARRVLYASEAEQLATRAWLTARQGDRN